MKTFRTLALVGIAAVAIAAGARVARAFLGGLVINQSYAVSQVVPIKLGQGVASLSASVAYSSPSFSATTFTTGEVSTGSVSIASNSLLPASAATDNIVVTSTSGSFGDYVAMSCPVGRGAVVARVTRDWSYGATTAKTATSLAAALTNLGPYCLGGVQFVASGSVVYATAPTGGIYNSIAVTTNNPGTLTIAHANFTGGAGATAISVNGRTFTAGQQFAVGGSASASATNLAAAINASPLSTFLTATPTSTTVGLQSKLAGLQYNFQLATSNSAAATVSGATMTGGLTPSWTLGGTSIKAPGHGFVTGLPVLYSQGSAPAISGLTDQTTYYAGVVDANDLALASSRSNAAAGTFITLASSSSLTNAATYMLSPLPFSAGSAGFNWVVSNDCATWSPLAISSVTYTAPGSSVYSFGSLPFSCLGLNVVAPNQGAMSIQVNAQGQ